MANEQITVEWIATAQQMLGTITKIDQRMAKQEEAMAKLGATSKKSANDAANSFNKLEKELKDNEAALKRMERGTKEFDEQRRKVDGLKQSLRQAKGELTQLGAKHTDLRGIGTAMMGAVHSAQSLVNALKAVAAAQREIITGGADAALTIDTLARKLQVQASLTDPERQAATKEILRQSSDAGLTAETGFRTATQLVSSGFQKPVETGTLTTAMKTMQAANLEGSPEEFIQGMSQVMAAFGLEKTNANLERVAVSMQGMFKTTDFQIAEATQFAKNAALFESAGMSLEQATATFTAGREVLNAEQASTGLRNVVSILQTAGAHGPQKEALASLGIKPEEVDLVGENMQQALTRLKQGVDAADKQTSQIAMGTLFGREASAAATVLMGKIPRMRELEGMQANKAQFEADVRVKQEGDLAQRNRIENEEMLRRLPRARALEDARNRIVRREGRNKGFAEDAETLVGPALSSTVTAATSVFGTTDQLSGLDVTGGAVGMGKLFGRMFGVGGSKLDEQNKLLQENNDLMRQQLQQPPQGQRQPAQRVVGPREAPKPGALIP